MAFKPDHLQPVKLILLQQFITCFPMQHPIINHFFGTVVQKQEGRKEHEHKMGKVNSKSDSSASYSLQLPQFRHQRRHHSSQACFMRLWDTAAKSPSDRTELNTTTAIGVASRTATAAPILSKLERNANEWNRGGLLSERPCERGFSGLGTRLVKFHQILICMLKWSVIGCVNRALGWGPDTVRYGILVT